VFRFYIIKRRRVRRPRKATAAKRGHYALHKETARTVILARLRELNEYYKLHYGKVAIRSQRSRWGSCSKKGNLNFNYQIAALPPELMDYVIVHELCHLKHFNHSPSFWSLVAEVLPNHKNLRLSLRKHHHLLK
jgi:predicted metal-dependent hydrolase